MTPGSSSQEAWNRSQRGLHDDFLELCAASITGDLSLDEGKRLREHLVVCSLCAEALQQYGSIARNVIPAVAAVEPAEIKAVDATWSQEQAEKAVFERLRREQTQHSDRADRRNGSSFFSYPVVPLSSETACRNVRVLYAAGILLVCALGFLAYRVGIDRANENAKATKPQPMVPRLPPAPANLEEQLSDRGHDRAVVNEEIAQRDKQIASLRRHMAQQSAEIIGLKAAQTRLESDLRAFDESPQVLVQQKADLARKLESAEHSAQALQATLDSLARQSAEDATRAKASDARVNDLARQLDEQEAAVDERDEMLAHDRDIREVMGARDLYIAEIYDVAGTGETKKPYGRVFYTRGKSLIFYAYDLDQPAELKRAGTFQAWGRRGPDRQQAINLGVFYQDNATRKRWILKCDDPKNLAQIDAVFVTVEPKGGSTKPSTKTLLFASLKIDPNHP
jgi:hypothetical protein